MIRIKSFLSNKKNGNGNGNGGGGNTTNVTNVTAGVNGVNIWGQYHDHTKDIDGDMMNVGNITSNGNITTTKNINGYNITATNNLTSNKVITGDINSSGNLTTNNITANGTITATGNITTQGDYYGENAYISDSVVCDWIEALAGLIGNLESTNITTEYLTVTKAAHFYKLIIDEIRATQGQIIVTPANAEIVKVVQEGTNYICYFLAENDGEETFQTFEANDQVVCQTFNAATGTQYNVSNRFYWAKVLRVSSMPSLVTLPNGDEKYCHYIYLDWTDKDSGTNAIPQVGDEIVQLGNRTDTTRQAAITIGAYNNPYLDSGIHAPFIIQYDGIDDYNLSAHRVNVISNGYNYFKGTFTTTTGDNIETLIDQTQQGAMTYVHTAYSNSSNGQLNFSKTYFNNALYIGFCSNHVASDASLTYTDYTWCRLRGENGTSANNYQLQADSLTIHVSGNTSDDDDFYVRGYQFDNNGKAQIYNYCRVTYIYPNSTDISNEQLPILMRPYQDGQAFQDGLKTIRFEMWDTNQQSILTQLDIPVIRDGDADALEEYKLIPISETVPIDNNGTLGISLQYNIMHIVGSNYELSTASNNLCVYFRPHYEHSTGSYTALSTGTTTPSYTNASYQTQWNSSQNKLLYIDIVLANQSPSNANAKVYDKRVAYAALAPSATFEITDGIKSTVQGHTTAIGSLTNSVTTISQQYNQISSTVSSHTTSINNLDGRVTTNETNITNITQKADSIESTVKNLKTSNKNLFNFTECRWMNAIPFIQGYGIEGKGTLNRIYKLGFDGIGGDFALTCWMKMKTTNTDVNVNLCDTNDPDQQTVRVTTEWKQFSFVFKNVTRYIGDVSDTGNYNGFLDFEASTISDSNRIYVKDIMLVRGNIPCDFNPSWKDYENVNYDELFDWSFDQNIAPTDEYYKGYQVYQPTQYKTTEHSYTDFIFKNNQNLKVFKPYTLSFYAKCDNPCVIQAYLYGNNGCVDGTITPNTPESAGEISIGNNSDGQTKLRIGTTWNKYIVHWYNHNSGQRNIIAYRDSIDHWDDDTTTPNLSICGVEFKEGYWDEDLLNQQSMIRQTATEIELKVNNTGININDGSITLNAENTTINGNLNLTNNNQGLILYDQYGNPKITIQNDTLGTLDNFNFGADKLFKTNTSSSVSTQTYNVNFPSITLGNFAAGQKLVIHDILVNSYNNNHFFDTPFNYVNFNYVIKCNGTQIATQSGTATKLDLEYKLTDYTNNSLANSGSYTIEISLTCVLQTTSLFGGFSHYVKLYCKKIQPSLNKIASDGAVFSSSVDQYNWFGSDQTMIRNGASAIRIINGKIQKNECNTQTPSYNTHFMDLSSSCPYTIVNALGYTPTLDDGIIAFSTVLNQQDSVQRTLHVPNPSTCAGKQYYVKNIVGGNTKVYVSGGDSSTPYFIQHGSNNKVNNLSIDNHSVILVSMGLYWLEFYC